ncbi:MAG: helix-turn-helix domain-containing protein [Candidatus Eisenbacteria bacterium]
MSAGAHGRPILLTVDEVAEWLKVSASTVYDWAARSRIPCVRLGGRLRFVEDDVLRWIEARKEG